MSKKITIIIATFILSFWFWVSINDWIEGDVLFAQVSEWLWWVILLIALSSLLSISYLLLADQNLKWRWSISWIVGLTYIMVFGFTWLNLLAICIIAMLMLYALHVTRMESIERIKLNIGLVVSRGMSTIVLSLLLTISFAYYQSPSLSTRINEGRENPVTFRDVMSMTIDNFLDVSSVDKTRRAANLSKEEFSDQIFSSATELFYDLTDKYSKFIPPVLAFGLFLLLWGLSFVFIWISVGLAILIFAILKSSGFLKVESIDVKAERLQL